MMRKTVLFASFLLPVAVSAKTLFELSRSNVSLGPAASIRCTELKYAQLGSYIDPRNRSKHSIEVSVSEEVKPLVYTVQIAGDEDLINGDKYKIFANDSEQLIAMTVLQPTTPSISQVVLDKVHGTLIYVKTVGRGLIGSKSAVGIASCRALK